MDGRAELSAADEVMLQIVRDEYDALKKEQNDRIKMREQMIYWILGGLAAVAGVAVQSKSVELFGVVPLLCFILGINRVRIDRMITSQRMYVRDVLDPRVQTILARLHPITQSGGQVTVDPVFAWEQPGRPVMPGGWLTNLIGQPGTRKAVQLAADLATTVVPASLATVIWLSAHWTALGALGASVDVVLTVLLLLDVVSAAECRFRGSPNRRRGTGSGGSSVPGPHNDRLKSV
jgi:hypothetical protein